MLFETATCAETHGRAIGRRGAVGGRATFGGLWDSGVRTHRVLVDLVFVLLAGDGGGNERALRWTGEERLVRCGISLVRRGARDP